MALPKLNHPTAKITLPSNKAAVVIRPFTVKEEKILLLAQSSGGEDALEAVKQVVSGCVVTPTFNVDKAPMFDIEYIFIKLRALSVNNKLELNVTDEDDGEEYKVAVDLDTVEVYFSPEHKDKIELTEDVGIVMKYPDISLMETIRSQIAALNDDEDNAEKAVDILFDNFARCIEKIWDAEGVYLNGSDFTQEEAVQFLYTIPSKGFQELQRFFETMPVLRKEVKYKTKEGVEKSFVLAGIADFFQ